MEKDDDRHWHLDKRVNIGHIITTLSIVAGMFVWGTSVETRIALLQQQGTDQRQWMRDIKVELRSLNEKVQQLVELSAYQRGLNDGTDR